MLCSSYRESATDTPSSPPPTEHAGGQSECRQQPEVALKILRVVGSRLRTLVDLIEELSFKTVCDLDALRRVAKSAQ